MTLFQTLDPQRTRSADLLGADYSENHGNKKNFEKFMKEKGPASIDNKNLKGEFRQNIFIRSKFLSDPN